MHGQVFRNQVLARQLLRKAAPSLFSGPKCTVAVPLDALREASLDPAVCTIHYRAAPNSYGTPPTLMGVVLRRIEGDFLLNVCQVQPQRSAGASSLLAEQLAASGLRLLERDAADIRREPIYSNVQEVWSSEHVQVSLDDRLRIGAALCEDGPQSIRELQDRAHPSCDIVSAVCALSCQGLLELDIRDRALGLNTIVRAI